MTTRILGSIQNTLRRKNDFHPAAKDWEIVAEVMPKISKREIDEMMEKLFEEKFGALSNQEK